MENEVLCLTRHSWQMQYVNQKKNKKSIWCTTSLKWKIRLPKEGSLRGFWSQIARNKFAILILAFKLPFLEWSQYHNLHSTTHSKLETCFLVYFSSEKIIRVLDEACNPSYNNKKILWLSSQAGHDQRGFSMRKSLFLSFLPLLCFNSDQFNFQRCFPGLPTAQIGFAPLSIALHWDARPHRGGGLGPAAGRGT